MVHRNFRHFLRKTATVKVLKHANRRVFPSNDDYREYKRYINSPYKGKYLADGLIKEFDRLRDEYESKILRGE